MARRPKAERTLPIRRLNETGADIATWWFDHAPDPLRRDLLEERVQKAIDDAEGRTEATMRRFHTDRADAALDRLVAHGIKRTDAYKLIHGHAMPPRLLKDVVDKAPAPPARRKRTP